MNTLFKFFLLSIHFVLGQNKVNVYEDFEKYPVYNSKIKEEKCCEHSIKQVITTNKALQFTLKSSDSLVSAGMRSEIAFFTEPTPWICRDYTFKIILPRTYLKDSEPEIYAQWHEVPDFKYGETWRNPPISLQIINGYWYLNIKWSKSQINTNSNIDGNKLFKLAKVRSGKIYNFKFSIKYSINNDGFVRCSINNVTRLNYNGPNYYNDLHGPFFKIGIYKATWKNNKFSKPKILSVIFDDISIK